MRPDYFGESVAASYDDDREMFAPEVIEPAVDFLAALAAGDSAAGDSAGSHGGEPQSSALELGIGTGRIALPLSDRGVLVHGIDLSAAMIARLRAKPGADRVTASIGDFATAQAGRTFPLVYLVYNTIENLTSQDDQVQCFVNAAAHLDPGGHFVIEVEVPALRRLPPGQTAVPFTVEPGRLGFDTYDIPSQGMVSHHYWTQDGGVRTLSVPFRYVWPSELDLMARIAGMRLVQRWGDWSREPFTGDSVKHVSVWQKIAQP